MTYYSSITLIKKMHLLLNYFINDIKIPNNKDFTIINYNIKAIGSSFSIKYKNYLIGTFYTNLFGIEGLESSINLIKYAFINGIDLHIPQYILLEIMDNSIIYYQKNKINCFISNVNDAYSLNNLLQSIKRIKHRKIILIAGLDGTRIYKRKLYGYIASNNSDYLILTENNCGYENIFSIFYDTTKNIIKDYYIELNRENAIKLAVKLAKPKDIIVIVGKGNACHDKILNSYYYHNDLEAIKKALA